jgi:hypothetical protein
MERVSRALRLKRKRRAFLKWWRKGEKKDTGSVFDDLPNPNDPTWRP